MDGDLRRRWEDLTGVLLVDEAEATRVLRDLWRRHDEPQRAYHRLSHVRHVLDVLDLIRAATPLSDPIAVRLAAWFHDAVYVPGARDNEARSAELAREVLEGWGLPPERVSHVAALVLTTASHRDDGTPDAPALIDADLAILAADPDTYELYRRAIRVEHGHVDEEGWRRGRSAFLAGMLDRETIFLTDVMRRRGEAAARRNMTAELATLTGR
jgi:predicted metal-dependent HD superfamily phosphohydrolase